MPVNGKNKKKIYGLLIDKYDCGPFDGGCLIFASALQKKYGGEIFVLCSERQAEHAALFLNGYLIDADGKLEPERFIKRFQDNEQVKIVSFRKIELQDLPETPQDKELSCLIASLL